MPTSSSVHAPSAGPSPGRVGCPCREVALPWASRRWVPEPQPFLVVDGSQQKLLLFCFSVYLTYLRFITLCRPKAVLNQACQLILKDEFHLPSLLRRKRRRRGLCSPRSGARAEPGGEPSAGLNPRPSSGSDLSFLHPGPVHAMGMREHACLLQEQVSPGALLAGRVVWGSPDPGVLSG